MFLGSLISRPLVEKNELQLLCYSVAVCSDEPRQERTSLESEMAERGSFSTRENSEPREAVLFFQVRSNALTQCKSHAGRIPFGGCLYATPL